MTRCERRDDVVYRVHEYAGERDSVICVLNRGAHSDGYSALDFMLESYNRLCREANEPPAPFATGVLIASQLQLMTEISHLVRDELAGIRAVLQQQREANENLYAALHGIARGVNNK